MKGTTFKLGKWLGLGCAKKQLFTGAVLAGVLTPFDCAIECSYIRECESFWELQCLSASDEGRVQNSLGQ